ncbi:MAG TPA: thiamine-phosphate kinase [Sphingomonas sp.]|uniref:thiamine-phosphate kinase n=1 Tax=Sphingomonas sp. TaxID=28214 RepID=UPI002C09A138|nr:thiamine-phosphate kinase [Sphingomonas sp.]HMI19597.1 thiamine-phosphate kinase [Sphingomonas sp.]
MSRERDFIDRLKPLARHPAARGLADDAAVLELGNVVLVLTHDMIVEGVHYLPGDPPGDVAWKLVAVNLSDLAAKGARPVGVLLGYSLDVAAERDTAFIAGLREALDAFAVPLLGGDTVQTPAGAPRAHGLTAIGEAPPHGAPRRAGAQAGDILYMTGEVGAAGLGLAIAKGEREGPAEWLAAYRRPQPRLVEGQALAPLVHAMADISDGLLIDAMRMAEAGGLAVEIDLEAVPIPEGADRMAAITAGDDYELLFAGPGNLSLSQPHLAKISAIGRFTSGHGLSLTDRSGAVPLPERLGYEHDAP